MNFNWFKNKFLKKNAQNKEKLSCKDIDGKEIELSEKEVYDPTFEPEEKDKVLTAKEAADLYDDLFESFTERTPAPDPEPKITFKLWCDDAPKLVLSSEYIDLLQEAGVDLFSLMINKANVMPNWQRLWNDKQIKQLAKMLGDRGIKLGMEKWLHPNRQQMDIMVADLLPICSEVQFAEIGDDGEGNWNKKFLSEFNSMTDAAKYLFESNDKLCIKTGGAKKTYTTFPAHWEFNERTAIYSQMVDFNETQVYSVLNRRVNGKDVKIDWNHKTLGPGYMQERYLPGVLKLGRPVRCALALYDQKWPEHTEEEAVMKCVDVALKYGVTDLAGWSSKWVLGKFGKKWTIPVIKKMKEAK